MLVAWSFLSQCSAHYLRRCIQSFPFVSYALLTVLFFSIEVRILSSKTFHHPIYAHPLQPRPSAEEWSCNLRGIVARSHLLCVHNLRRMSLEIEHCQFKNIHWKMWALLCACVWNVLYLELRIFGIHNACACLRQCLMCLLVVAVR